MRKTLLWCGAAVIILGLAALAGYFGVKSKFPRPYLDVVTESGADANVVYSVMKAESGFQEGAVSVAGAVGLMQLLPSTAEYICRLAGRPFDTARLKEGAYNTELGCLYLKYLMERFPARETALAAYNAGEGVVSAWLKIAEYSPDGVRLQNIPYAETDAYLKKIGKFLKIYEFFYG